VTAVPAAAGVHAAAAAAAAAASDSASESGEDEGQWVMCDHCSKWRSLPPGYKVWRVTRVLLNFRVQGLDMLYPKHMLHHSGSGLRGLGSIMPCKLHHCSCLCSLVLGFWVGLACAVSEDQCYSCSVTVA
jgi:hypothetical protein